MKFAIRTAPLGTELTSTSGMSPESRLCPLRGGPEAFGRGGSARATRGGLNSPAAWLGFALLVMGCCAQAAPTTTTKAADASTNAPAATEIEIPQSVFVLPASSREGRNPFFPHSVALQSVQKPKQQALDTSSIVLNGITSRPRPSVMINGITFEKGEEHEIRVSGGGRVKVRCDDIRQDSAVVVVNGVEQRELRMRSGL